MPKNATVRARVDQQVKSRAEKILRRVGVSTSDAVNLLLHQIILRDGLPFDVRVPNKATIAAMQELDAGGGEVFTGPTAEVFDGIVGRRKPRFQRKA